MSEKKVSVGGLALAITLGTLTVSPASAAARFDGDRSEIGASAGCSCGKCGAGKCCSEVAERGADKQCSCGECGQGGGGGGNGGGNG